MRPAPTAWPRLPGGLRPGPTRAQLLAGLLCAVLGFALVVQVRQTQSEGLSSLRQSELVSILDNVSDEAEQLDRDARDLQATRDKLRSGSDGPAAAQQAAKSRLDVLGVLAGTLPADRPRDPARHRRPGPRWTRRRAARHPAGAARRRCRGGPDRHGPGGGRHLLRRHRRAGPGRRHPAEGAVPVHRDRRPADPGRRAGDPRRRPGDAAAAGRHAEGRATPRQSSGSPPCDGATGASVRSARSHAPHPASTCEEDPMADLSTPTTCATPPTTSGSAWTGDVARVGITAYAQEALGDIVFVTLPDGGRRGAGRADRAARSSRPRASATCTPR